MLSNISPPLDSSNRCNAIKITNKG